MSLEFMLGYFVTNLRNIDKNKKRGVCEREREIEIGRMTSMMGNGSSKIQKSWGKVVRESRNCNRLQPILRSKWADIRNADCACTHQSKCHFKPALYTNKLLVWIYLGSKSGVGEGAGGRWGDKNEFL